MNVFLNRNIGTIFMAMLISVLYAYLLSSMPHYLFKDRENYIIIYGTDFDYYLSQMTDVKMLLFNEPLFFLVNKALSIFNDPEFSVKAIVFFICFSASYFCLTNFNNLFFGILFLIILFFNTQFFALQVIALRQGLGLALIFLVLPRIPKIKFQLLFFIGLGLIHNSFFLIFAFLGINYVLESYLKIQNFRKRIILLFVIGIIINGSMLLIANILGSKQAYDSFDNTSSGLMFVIWAIVFIVLYIQKHSWKGNTQNLNPYIISIVGLILYLTSYFLSPVAGRIIGTFIPFIYLSLFKNMKEKELILLILLTCINTYIFFNGGAESFLNADLNEFWKQLL